VAVEYGGIYRSDDAGLVWEFQESSQHGHHLLRVSALDEDNAWIVGALVGYGPELGVVVHTADGGDNWETQALPVNAALFDVAFVPGPLYLPLTFR
jgi:photosystem II stability/assembly factor-like uncharacterized protein